MTRKTKEQVLYWILFLCLFLAVYMPLNEIVFDGEAPIVWSLVVGVVAGWLAMWFWESRWRG